MNRVESIERAMREEEAEETRRWSEGLEAIACRLDGYFARSEERARMRIYLRGLLSPAERKNSWQLAEAVGEETPYGIQHLLGRAVWSADQVRDDLLCYVRENLADPQGILVLDETGFLKKGDKSAGVARQYSGTAGRIENSQIGVFTAYVSPTKAGARTLVDRALYLPQAWTQAPERCRAAGIPEEIVFATKPQLARELVERILASGLPCAWVVADTVYGNDGAFRLWLEERHQPYALGVSAQYRIFDGEQREWVDTVVKRLPAKAWKKVSCGAGTKGERVYEWTRFVIRSEKDGFCRWLLARRSLEADEEVAYFVVYGAKTTTLKKMVRVVGARWAIEECFETAKSELGLDEYEVRSWTGWHRHITLVMWLQALLSVVRAQSQSPTPAPQRGQKKGGKSKVTLECYDQR
jgi:SRSO17 transposase